LKKNKLARERRERIESNGTVLVLGNEREELSIGNVAHNDREREREERAW
jgi:hypothetical protein